MNLLRRSRSVIGWLCIAMPETNCGNKLIHLQWNETFTFHHPQETFRESFRSATTSRKLPSSERHPRTPKSKTFTSTPEMSLPHPLTLPSRMEWTLWWPRDSVICPLWTGRSVSGLSRSRIWSRKLWRIGRRLFGIFLRWLLEREVLRFNFCQGSW